MNRCGRERRPFRGGRLAGQQRRDRVRGHRRHQDPVAVMPTGQQQPVRAAAAHDRAVVRRARPQAGAGLSQDQLAGHRQHAHRVVQQVVHGTRGHRPVCPAFLRSGAHDQLPVGPRDQVDVRAADDGPDRVAEHGRQARRVAQPQQLALDGPDHGPQRVRQPADLAGPAAGGHHDLGRVDVLATREPDTAGPPVAGPDLQHAIPHEADLRQAGRFPQGRDVAAVVDGPVAREEHAAVHVGGEEGLHARGTPGCPVLRRPGPLTSGRRSAGAAPRSPRGRRPRRASLRRAARPGGRKPPPARPRTSRSGRPRAD